MKVKRREPGKVVKVYLDAHTRLMLQDLARDRKIKTSDLVRACVDQCLPDLTSGNIEVECC